MKLLDERICVLFKCHWQHTLVFWSVFFSFGLCIAFLGPTILDLRCQTQSTLQQITWVFFSQQLFLLVGSSVEGLFKKTLLCSLSALFCCTFVISLVFAVIPLCNHVVLLSIAMAIAGLSMGVIDTIANRQLVKLYQKDSATFLQALHFFIGLGALVTPLVADPFLAEDSCVLGVNLTANSSSSSTSDLGHLRSSMAGQGAALPNISQYPLHTEGRVITRVSYAFWIMAIINLPVPAAVLTLMYRERMLPCSSKSQHLLDKDSKTSRSPSGESESHNVDTEEGHGSLFCCCNTANIQGHPATFFVIHALGGAILFITDGIIGSYAGFVYTYAVSPPLLMGHKTAGCLDSIFWAAITLGRLAFIYLSSKYTSSRLLTISLVGVILVQCLLLIFYTSSVFLFVGTCVLGLCISSVFPSMLAFTEDILDYKDISKSRCEVPVQPIRESFPQTLQGGARRSFHSNCIFMLTLVQLSPEIFMGCATTVLVTCASTGEMALQLIVGSVINSQGSYSFLLCCTGASFIAFCLFLLFLYIHHIHRNFQKDWSKYTEMEEKPKPGGS